MDAHTRSHRSVLSIVAVLQLLVFGGLTLYSAREVFVPISFAVFISFVLYPICAWMERKGTGRLTSILINMSIVTLLLAAVVSLLIQQFLGFVNEWPLFKQRLLYSLGDLQIFFDDVVGISRDQQDLWLSQLASQSASDFWRVLGNMISGSAFSLVMMALIPIYAVLILYYRHIWVEVLCRIFPDDRRNDIMRILRLSIDAYYNFIKGMAIVYLVVGILNSVGLVVIGIPHAILFGCIAAVLTFIPYVGIIVGSLLPVAMAWITYDSIWYPVGVVGVFSLVQYLEANLIFPLAVSNRLNVNTFVMLVAIFTGGLLWGVSGMILFVPFAGILKLIADNSPGLKTLSVALGTKGKD